MKCDKKLNQLLTPIVRMIGNTFQINKSCSSDDISISGIGYSSKIVACEIVSFIRRLYQSGEQWKRIVTNFFISVIEDAADSMSLFIGTENSDQRNLPQAIGTFDVLGSHIDTLRVGGKAIYKPTNQKGLIVSYNPEMNDIGMLFTDNYSEEVRHYPADSVIVCDEYPPPYAKEVIEDDEVRDVYNLYFYLLLLEC